MTSQDMHDVSVRAAGFRSATAAATSLRHVMADIAATCRDELAFRNQSLRAGRHLGLLTSIPADTPVTQLIGMAVSEMAGLSSRDGIVTLHTAALADKMLVSVEGSNRLDLPEGFLTGFISVDPDFRAAAAAAGVSLRLFWQQGLGPAVELLAPLHRTEPRFDARQVIDLSIRKWREQPV